MIPSHNRTILFSKMLPYIYTMLSGILAFASIVNASKAEEYVIDFETVEIGKPTAKWTDQGVQIELAHPPKKSKAIGRITFFAHLGTGHKGVVNAMANEAIPMRASFEHVATKVTVQLWASTTSAAFLEAFDKDGKSLGRQAIERAPVRKSPEDHVPFFELNVEAVNIAYIEIGGSKPGGFVAVDELRWTTD